MAASAKRSVTRKSSFLRYAVEWPAGTHPAMIELTMISKLGYLEFRGRKCGNGLAYHVKEFMKLAWPDMDWHRWTNLIIDTFLESPGRTACFGPSSCVPWETRLENPTTGEAVPIGYLCENRIAPVVQTINGPRQASVPFLKGVAPICEVTLASGAKFRCTAEHRVMLASGHYATASSLRPGALLRGYSRFLPSTILGTDPLIRASDAPHSMRTAPDSQFDCRPEFHFGDERLHSEANTGQRAFPSLAYARKHMENASFGTGDLEHTAKHTHASLEASRLSIEQIAQLSLISETYEQPHAALKTLESSFGQTQRDSLCQSALHWGPQPFSESNPDSCHKHYHDDEFRRCSNAFSCGPRFTVHADVVSSITWSKAEKFYDLHVPIENHYFADGVIHHNSGKSFMFSRAALTMFYARPHGTTVLISSTTLDALKRRIWDYVVSSHRDAKQAMPWLPGSLIESKLMLLADESTQDGRSFKNGVVGVACRKSGGWTGLQEYVGTKNEVVLLISDEANYMQEGFLESLANLESNEKCYAAIMGNLPDVFNPLGRAAEPKMGWDSLPDTDKTRVYETKWKNGRAIQLIGMDSPNLDYPEGQEPFKNLIGRRYIEQCAQNYGRESDKFNMFASGKIPRASMMRTVFTKAQATKFRAMEGVTWGHRPLERGYCIDVAYSGVGGDRTVGRVFLFGLDIENKWRVWFGPKKIYSGSTDPKKSHAEAIADEVKIECESHGVPPEHLFYDGTGRSEFTLAVARAWSTKVVSLEFGGMATERISFTGEKHLHGDNQGERKTCKESFDRFVSELWFAVAYGIFSDQVRGLDEETVDEMCQRKWEMVRGSKQSIETKEDMKERGLRSPDLGDCVVVGMEGARRLGFPLGRDAVPSKARTSQWLKREHDNQWDKLKRQQLEAA